MLLLNESLQILLNSIDDCKIKINLTNTLCIGIEGMGKTSLLNEIMNQAEKIQIKTSYFSHMGDVDNARVISGLYHTRRHGTPDYFRGHIKQEYLKRVFSGEPCHPHIFFIDTWSDLIDGVEQESLPIAEIIEKGGAVGMFFFVATNNVSNLPSFLKQILGTSQKIVFKSAPENIGPTSKMPDCNTWLLTRSEFLIFNQGELQTEKPITVAKSGQLYE